MYSNGMFCNIWFNYSSGSYATNVFRFVSILFHFQGGYAWIYWDLFINGGTRRIFSRGFHIFWSFYAKYARTELQN